MNYRPCICWSNTAGQQSSRGHASGQATIAATASQRAYNAMRRSVDDKKDYTVEPWLEQRVQARHPTGSNLNRRKCAISIAVDTCTPSAKEEYTYGTFYGISRGSDHHNRFCALLNEILDLSAEERLQLVENIWDSLAASADSVPVPGWHQAELERRLDDPDERATVSCEEVQTRLRNPKP